ncbi:MAG: hypothetical protein ACOC1K_08215 [Nanoarchaeota archaeon]
MKILLLTPIDTVNNSIYYTQLVDFLKERNVLVLSIPFFAETNAIMEERFYLPTLFSMLKTLKENNKVKRKVYGNGNLLLVGNSYKDHEFDMIISLGSEEDDTYMEALRSHEDFKNFGELINVDELYKWEDAEINLPTLEHAKKFLEGVFKKKNG